MDKLMAHTPVVIVRCIRCKQTWGIRPSEVAPHNVLMCNICFMPMIAEHAVIKKATPAT